MRKEEVETNKQGKGTNKKASRIQEERINSTGVGVARGRLGYWGFSAKKRKAPFSTTPVFFLMFLLFSFHASPLVLLWDEWNFNIQKAANLAFCVLWQMCWLSNVSTGAKLYKANERQSLLSLPFVQCKNHPLDGTIAKLNNLRTTTSK